MAILPENEYTEFESRSYINPQLTVDETNTFVDNLRQSQRAGTQQINSDTQSLGTDVPSNLGGLVGGTGYWTRRYQTPQTNSAVADLQATAQATALNSVLANEKAKWQKRYNDAYRAYQQRQHAKANAATATSRSLAGVGEVETNTVSPEDFFGVPDSIVSETDTHYIYTDPETGEQVKISKDYMDKIYDENGNLTDEGAVILDTRRLLGL